MNTLEHVNAPLQLLSEIKAILRPGGVLVVDVPNNYVLAHRSRLRGRWPVLELGEHINHFTPSTMDQLVASVGFRPIARLPGLVRGVGGLGQDPGVRKRVRWVIARLLMALTGGAIQTFPHMTMIYRLDP